MRTRKLALEAEIKDQITFENLVSPPRLFTRHFQNLMFTLDHNQLSLLLFLTFMSEKNNSIEYSVKLMKQYKWAVQKVQSKKRRKKIGTSLPTVRKNFIRLIEQGLLIRSEDQFIINPNLTYSKQVSLKDWREKKDNVNEYAKL